MKSINEPGIWKKRQTTSLNADNKYSWVPGKTLANPSVSRIKCQCWYNMCTNLLSESCCQNPDRGLTDFHFSTKFLSTNSEPSLEEVKSGEICSRKAHKSPQNKSLHFEDFELPPSARHWLDWIFSKGMLDFHFEHSGRWFYENFQMEVLEWNPEIIYWVVKQMWIYYRVVLINTVIMVEYQEKATFKIFICFELFCY